MSDNNYDIFILRKGDGWKIEVDYWHYSRGEDRRMTSKTSYTWFTKCAELVDNFQHGKRTKAFYCQLRVLVKKYGVKDREKYKFVRKLQIG